MIFPKRPVPLFCKDWADRNGRKIRPAYEKVAGRESLIQLFMSFYFQFVSTTIPLDRDYPTGVPGDIAEPVGEIFV